LFILQDSGANLKDSGPVTPIADGSGVTIQLARLSGLPAGDYMIVLQSAGQIIANVKATLELVPLIQKIDPATYSIKAPGCSDTCSFTIGGQRLSALTAVNLVDSSGKVTAATFDAKTSKAAFAKKDLDGLSPGAYDVKGNTADAAVDATSSVKFTITQ
jgi:hypothetical protein